MTVSMRRRTMRRRSNRFALAIAHRTSCLETISSLLTRHAHLITVSLLPVVWYTKIPRCLLFELLSHSSGSSPRDRLNFSLCCCKVPRSHHGCQPRVGLQYSYPRFQGQNATVHNAGSLWPVLRSLGEAQRVVKKHVPMGARLPHHASGSSPPNQLSVEGGFSA